MQNFKSVSFEVRDHMWDLTLLIADLPGIINFQNLSFA